MEDFIDLKVTMEKITPHLLTLGQPQWEFHVKFHDIKYHQFCWRGKEREGWSFIRCEESFITMKLIWHGYLVPNLNIRAHETPTKTALKCMMVSGTIIRGTLIRGTKSP